MSDLAAIEARLHSLLAPYRDEAARTPRSMACRAFAGPARGHTTTLRRYVGARVDVSLYLLVADTFPDALDGTPEALLKRRSGKATFTFPRLDDEMVGDLEQLLTRLYARYRAAHAG